MYLATDTIVALATPPGRGGLGVVRVSGAGALDVVGRMITRRAPLQPRLATRTFVRAAGSVIDEAIATYFPAPRSYTGEDVVELSAHGSPVVLRAVVEAARASGARLAAPGEFTLRAFLNGRVDLAQAEAVGDLIDAVTPRQARAAFDQLQGTLTTRIGAIERELFDLIARLEASVDFPEEGYHFLEAGEAVESLDAIIARTADLLAGARRGRLVREGLQTVIVGRPNVGKSSVFNALLGASRAIVTDRPGTTRDLVTEVVDLNGLRMTVVDTAGVRRTSDPVEREGVAMAARARDTADLVLVIVDRSAPLEPDDQAFIDEVPGARRVLVANKSDLAPAWERQDAIPVCALTGHGFDALREAIVGALDVGPVADEPALTNVRHIELVQRAQEALIRARAAAGGGTPEEFVLADLQEARGWLEEVTGRRTTEDLLERIFSTFCVGK